MNVLLSVKPKYAKEIISGRKKYEFRKSIFKRDNVEKMYIYSSSSVRKIIAIVDIDGILSDSPQELWEQCHEDAGISEGEFFDYFKNSETGYAIKIFNVHEFPTPIDPYHLDEDFRPPQSFYYLPISYLQNCWNYQSSDMNYLHGILTEPCSGYSCPK
ncbi:MAG: ASCH domain-containing protein [Deltaproteobacteria bacterium]|nr:ASCH domain-containing protein [Deltaproteobacteria bacterium]